MLGEERLVVPWLAQLSSSCFSRRGGGGRRVTLCAFHPHISRSGGLSRFPHSESVCLCVRGGEGGAETELGHRTLLQIPARRNMEAANPTLRCVHRRLPESADPPARRLDPPCKWMDTRRLLRSLMVQQNGNPIRNWGPGRLAQLPLRSALSPLLFPCFNR